MKVMLVALFGAVGALSRYGIGVAVGARSFPWATLGINLIGSYLLGLVLVLGAERHWPSAVTVAVAIGFLGAFTTFSTFSYEAYTLLRTNRAGAAALYVAVSMAGGLLAAAAGYATGRTIA